MLTACSKAGSKTILFVHNDEANEDYYLRKAQSFMDKQSDGDQILIQVKLEMDKETLVDTPADVVLYVGQDTLDLSKLKEQDQILRKALAYEEPFVLYNETLFIEHGLSKPQNTNDFFHLCATFQSLGIEPLMFKQAEDGTLDLELLAKTYWLNNGILDEDQGVIDNPGFGDLFNLAYQLHSEGFKQAKTSVLVDEVLDGLRSGTVAMYFTDTGDARALEMAKEPGFSSFNMPGSFGLGTVPKRITSELILINSEALDFFSSFEGDLIEGERQDLEVLLNQILRLEIEQEDIK